MGVVSKTGDRREPSLTSATDVRLPLMRSYMLCEFALRDKTLLAHFTLVWPLTRVRTHVYPQPFTPRKFFVACATLVVLFSRVYLHVSLEASQESKSLVAHCAMVGSLLRMDCSMPGHVTMVREPLPTSRALMIPVYGNEGKSQMNSEACLLDYRPHIYRGCQRRSDKRAAFKTFLSCERCKILSQLQ